MAPNPNTPIMTASICAVMNATCADISCSKPPYMNQFIIVYYYLVVFQYDQGLPSNDHSGVCFLPEPLHNRYNIYKFPSIYMTSNVRNRVPRRLCNHGMSIMIRDSFQPITLGNLRHLLETCQLLVLLSNFVSYWSLESQLGLDVI